MVKALLPSLLIACILSGCGDPSEANTQRSRPLTVDEQVANIEKRTDMPEAIKEQTIASLRAQQAAQQQNQGK